MKKLAPTTLMVPQIASPAPAAPALRPLRPTTQVLEGEFEQEAA